MDKALLDEYLHSLFEPGWSDEAASGSNYRVKVCLALGLGDPENRARLHALVDAAMKRRARQAERSCTPSLTLPPGPAAATLHP